MSGLKQILISDKTATIDGQKAEIQSAPDAMCSQVCWGERNSIADVVELTVECQTKNDDTSTCSSDRKEIRAQVSLKDNKSANDFIKSLNNKSGMGYDALWPLVLYQSG